MLKIAGPMAVVRFYLLIVGRVMVPYLFPHEIDVSNSLECYNDNCCHADVSLSVRLLIPRYVRL